MAQQVSQSIENNFTKGLITEATGLSFPENAAFDTDNCIYTIVGDVIRREGFNYETNFAQDTVDRTGKAMSTYKWNNVGGDGLTQIVVRQIGSTLYFFQSTNATVASPLSTTKLASTITISSFLASGSAADPSITECQFTDGNGYLFVFHPNLEPFYCTFNAGTITASPITVKIRDFGGITEPGVSDSLRPGTLTNEHNYNLQNQGWTAGGPWIATSSTLANWNNPTFNITLTVAAGLTIVGGARIRLLGNFNVGPRIDQHTASGVVNSYSGTTLVLTIQSVDDATFAAGLPSSNDWTVVPVNTGYISSWNTNLSNYPSNTDVWWSFKNASNVFDPLNTVANVTLGSGPAPKGFFVFNAFKQTRSSNSTVPSLTDVITTARPKTGTWFQGRVWYTGIDASQQATGDAQYYTWTENIYFSQIITTVTQFGNCYQTNDPTSETLFDLLPTDGGVITIQGSGSIHRLFPIQNGLLVFAANGIWFITGSQGIGFSAKDYTIAKISGIEAVSSTSFINVMGYPLFWNEEGIYAVAPGQTGSLTVNNLALGTILSFYGNIPIQSKKFARGDYNPIDYIVQWVYRSTNESSVTTRYEYDKVLCFNTANKAFYTYTISGTPHVHGVRYVVGPGGSTSPSPGFKYLTSVAVAGPTYKFTFAEENDPTTYKDWFANDGIGVNYVSFFTTGYKIRGQAIKRWQPGYLYLFLRNSFHNSYKIQGLWEFGISGNSGKWSTVQEINDFTSTTNFGVIYRRHKIRGHGLVFQLKISSVDGKPFDVVGWSIFEIQNASV